jgi:hypothetical protein
MMNCENSSRGDSFIVFMVKKESNDIVLPESLFDFVFLGGGGGGSGPSLSQYATLSNRKCNALFAIASNGVSNGGTAK